ncbi:hypothetical protein GA0115253_109485 [Streptomyces sp. Termitarium-T10T-6]|nr:hypothetical protein [Streptomyces sp. Termitarium-T10T-6]SCE61463.1 hypothetical protein GA0115253_109485 [Streptomyces sp. Termitarium-T10T-6]
MSLYGHDHRLVQTGVIGHKDSDHPVILPMDAHELDLWRRAHPDYSYWCGTQLGGCGGELSDRRYTNKVCHFAHHPNAICHRTANGESSADHLFIKRGVQRLLNRQQVHGKVKTRDLGTGPGDAVDVHLPGARRKLRFQLSGLDYRAWRRAADDLAEEGVDELDWVFGPDTPVTRELASRHGFCLRVRLETVGGERRVHIGAEAQDRTVEWTPLEDCELTSTGLITPRVESIRVSQPRPKPFAFPLLGGLVFAPVPEASAPTNSPFIADDRHLIVADIKPVDSPIVRALLSLPGYTDPPPADHVYRAAYSTHMLVTEGGGWAVHTDRYVRLNANEAQRTGLWVPPPMVRNAPAPATSPPSQPKPPAEPQASTPEPAHIQRHPAKPTALTKADLVVRLRDALAERARLGATTTWEALAKQIGFDVAELSAADRCDLLVEMDSPLSEYVPVRSALLREGTKPLPYLGDILDRLGVPYAKGSSQLRQWAVVERDRAYAAYGQPARAMGARLNLAPTQRQLLTKTPAPRKPVQVLTVRRSEPKQHARTDARMSDLIAQLREVRPRLTKSVRKRVNRSIRGAESWLGTLPVQRVPARARAAAQSREHHVRSLENALTAARTDIAGSQFLARHQEAQKSAAPKAEETVPIPTQFSSAPTASISEPTAEERLTRELIWTASRGETVPLLNLEGGMTLPDATLRKRLVSVDRNAGPDAPLLSALVTAPAGGPVLFFRKILDELGLAVPQTDQALRAIWHREQERAYAAHASSPRPIPPRLVPPAKSVS